jgi:ABC-type branched-subunit amino acid transport system permease subunit
MNKVAPARGVNRYAPLAVAWAALIALPWWLPALGGYTALGSKVLIYGLATMGLNLLIGFTGALSFGQAAYFGLGAYGAGMTLKYIAASTPLAILIGTAVGGLAATILGPVVMLHFLGVRVEYYVWAAFAVAGFITALAGTLNALLFNFTSPEDLHWILSGNFVIMIVLGGMRSFWGPLLGVVIFVVAQDYLSGLTGNWMTIIGLMFVVIVLLFPRGILGALPRRTRAA